jgi:hypothetical protein
MDNFKKFPTQYTEENYKCIYPAINYAIKVKNIYYELPKNCTKLSTFFNDFTEEYKEINDELFVLPYKNITELDDEKETLLIGYILMFLKYHSRNGYEKIEISLPLVEKLSNTIFDEWDEWFFGKIFGDNNDLGDIIVLANIADHINCKILNFFTMYSLSQKIDTISEENLNNFLGVKCDIPDMIKKSITETHTIIPNKPFIFAL